MKSNHQALGRDSIEERREVKSSKADLTDLISRSVALIFVEDSFPSLLSQPKINWLTSIKI